MNDITGRTDFVETWLTEMPQGLGSFPTFDQIEYTIKDRIKSGSPIIDVNDVAKKNCWSTSYVLLDRIKGSNSFGYRTTN